MNFTELIFFVTYLKQQFRKFRFCQWLRSDQIQNDDQNTDGVDRVHQHPQSFTVSCPRQFWFIYCWML